jgi:putative oxidoreductase
MDEGLLLLRVIVGPLMAAHGAQKLLGWFGGPGLTGTAGFMEALGFRPGRLFGATAASAEIVSGVLMFLGLLGPVGPALMVSVMIVAGVSVHWKNGLFASAGGIEVPLLYATVAAGLTLMPPGRYSLDAVLGWTSLWTPETSWLALGIGIAAGIINLFLRRPVPQVGEVTS